MSALTDYARAQGRDYITPEDVSDLLSQGADPDQVRRDVLEVLGAGTRSIWAEDSSLCAWIAFRGTP